MPFVKDRRFLAFALIAVIAVVLGLLLGRSSCCAQPETPPAFVDAGTAALGPPDAGVAVALATDAGEEAPLPVVAPSPSSPEHDRVTHASTHTPTERPPREKREKPPKPDKVAVVAEKPDAGFAPEPAAVVDAGPPKRVEHKDLEAEALPSAPLTVTYTDGVSAWLLLTQVRVFIDGKRVTDEHSATMIDATKGKTFYEGKLFPGTHQVRVETIYVGKPNGVFGYMEAYHPKLRAMVVVEVAEGKTARVDASAYDKGAMEQWENRWGVKIVAK